MASRLLSFFELVMVSWHWTRGCLITVLPVVCASHCTTMSMLGLCNLSWISSTEALLSWVADLPSADGVASVVSALTELAASGGAADVVVAASFFSAAGGAFWPSTRVDKQQNPSRHATGQAKTKSRSGWGKTPRQLRSCSR